MKTFYNNYIRKEFRDEINSRTKGIPSGSYLNKVKRKLYDVLFDKASYEKVIKNFSEILIPTHKGDIKCSLLSKLEIINDAKDNYKRNIKSFLLRNANLTGLPKKLNQLEAQN